MREVASSDSSHHRHYRKTTVTALWIEMPFENDIHKISLQMHGFVNHSFKLNYFHLFPDYDSRKLL